MDRKDPHPTETSQPGGEIPADPPTRREVLAAVGKYSAFLAATSTVILSAEDVLAQQKPCSQIGGNGNGLGPPRCGETRPPEDRGNRAPTRLSPSQQIQQRIRTRP